jgi:hypothetical protein
MVEAWRYELPGRQLGRLACKKVLAVSEFATKERYDLWVPGNACAPRLPAYNAIEAQG